jgi:hypothetical protein
VQAEWSYTGATRARDKLGLSMIQRFPMRQIIGRGWRKALDRYAASKLA